MDLNRDLLIFLIYYELFSLFFTVKYKQSDGTETALFRQVLTKESSIYAILQKVQQIENWLKPFNHAYLTLPAKFPLKLIHLSKRYSYPFLRRVNIALGRRFQW